MLEVDISLNKSLTDSYLAACLSVPKIPRLGLNNYMWEERDISIMNLHKRLIDSAHVIMTYRIRKQIGLEVAEALRRAGLSPDPLCEAMILNWFLRAYAVIGKLHTNSTKT